MFSKKPSEMKEFHGIIPKNFKFDGKIEFTGSLILNGEFHGDIIKGERLEIGATGRLEGNAEVERADISGHFKGTLRIRQELLLHKTAVVEGEIYLETNAMETEPGARVEGQIHMPKESPTIAKTDGGASPDFKAQPARGKA